MQPSAVAQEGMWEQSEQGCPALPPCHSTRTLDPETEQLLMGSAWGWMGAGGPEPRSELPCACGNTTLCLEEVLSRGCCGRRALVVVNLLLCSEQKRATKSSL